MVSILIEAGHIMKLNLDAIPNSSNISDDFSGLYYDPKAEYSVPTNGEPLVSVSTQPLLVMTSHDHGD